MNIKILVINELRCTRMGKFNSDGYYSYYCRKESLRRNSIILIVNKRVRNAVLGCNLKNDRMISIHFQGNTGQHNSNPSCAPNTNAEEAEVEWFYEDLQDFIKVTS